MRLEFVDTNIAIIAKASVALPALGPHLKHTVLSLELRPSPDIPLARESCEAAKGERNP